MKKTGSIFLKTISFENLLASFHLAVKGCGKTETVCRFFYNLEPELLNLKNELQNGTYQPGAYHFFTISDPKVRTIAVAPFRDRVVHHAVVSILNPIYERSFIYDSYATRAEKGTHKAVRRAQKFIRKRPWYFKTDIQKYFDSVNHSILIEIIQRKIKDSQMLNLIKRIIANAPVTNMGLPIGNLTSQFLANVYLDPLDHYLKDQIGIREYLRYMDDFVIFGDDKQDLLFLKPMVEQFLSERLKLKLHPAATIMNRSMHGLSFLGMRIFPNHIRIKPENRKRSLKRLKMKIIQWENNKIDEHHMAQSLTSIAGHLRYFCPAMRIPY